MIMIGCDFNPLSDIFKCYIVDVLFILHVLFSINFAEKYNR